MKFLLLYISLIAMLYLQSCSKSSEAFSASAEGSVKNGSMSRMITVGNYLYAVDDASLITLDASAPAALQVTNRTKLGAQIQTIFHYSGHLYIGSASTMYVYDINTTPAAPSLKSSFAYPPVLLARDPIIAFDSVIYSTVTSDVGFGSFRVFNNKNVSNPVLLGSINLQQPRGMDRADTVLYLCNGRAGLYLFNIKQPFSPVFMKAIDENNTLINGAESNNDYFDAIVIPPLLFCYTRGSLLNYNISNPASPVFLNKTN